MSCMRTPQYSSEWCEFWLANLKAAAWEGSSRARGVPAIMFCSAHARLIFKPPPPPGGGGMIWADPRHLHEPKPSGEGDLGETDLKQGKPVPKKSDFCGSWPVFQLAG